MQTNLILLYVYFYINKVKYINMKQLVITVILAFLTSTTITFADSWDDFADLDRAWDGQKSITNKEFEQVMDALQEKKIKKETRQKKRRARKITKGGTSLHTELNPEKTINEIQPLKSEKEGMLVNIPVRLYVDGKYLEKGFYQIFAEKENDGKIYLNLYQSQFFQAKVEAEETEYDFEQNEVNFAQLLPYNDTFVKLIYGCVNFNAYAFIPYDEE